MVEHNVTIEICRLYDERKWEFATFMPFSNVVYFMVSASSCLLSKNVRMRI
jgi:hypothetical protein